MVFLIFLILAIILIIWGLILMLKPILQIRRYNSVKSKLLLIKNNKKEGLAEINLDGIRYITKPMRIARNTTFKDELEIGYDKNNPKEAFVKRLDSKYFWIVLLGIVIFIVAVIVF